MPPLENADHDDGNDQHGAKRVIDAMNIAQKRNCSKIHSKNAGDEVGRQENAGHEGQGAHDFVGAVA